MKNFKFKKEFGQNFIFDGNLLSAIVSDSEITEEDEVLEIGAGAGTLTQKLCEKAKKVVAYEIDKNLTEHLRELEGKNNNLKVIIADALKTPIQEIESNFSGNYKIVANLPYYITSPMIFKFLEQTKRVLSLTVMVQKEVAERFGAKENTKDYGVSTIMINYQADVKYLRTVGRKMFTPPPNVDSALIKITPNEKKERAKGEEFFVKLVKASFSMRRKTLQNNLLSISIPKEKTVEALKMLSKPETTRAEELSISEFISLSNFLN